MLAEGVSSQNLKSPIDINSLTIEFRFVPTSLPPN